MKVNQDNNKVTMEISDHEAILLVNALNEIINGPDAIEDWEFHSRTGFNKKQAEEFLEVLNKSLKNI